MASLSAHLVEAGDHGRLGFHPSCPVCRRDRLFGTLSSEPVVSRRAQAVLAGGVLAVSTAAPGAALAQEPDHQGEGVALPDQATSGELDDPGFDPGGETVLPYETAPVPPTAPGGGEEDAGEGAPLDVEPVDDPDAQLVPLSETEPPVTGEEVPVPPAEAVVPPGEPSVPPEPSGDSPQADELSSAEDTDTDPEARRPDEAPAQRDAKAEPQRSDTGGTEPSEALGDPVPPATAPVPTGEPVVLAQPSTPTTNPPDLPLGDARVHVVQPGESLWSIAKRLLGGEASPARIAREVNRLWSLNESRIGTGDPDLLMVGTKLRLP